MSIAQWFDPRIGTWLNIKKEKLASSAIGIITLPNFFDNEDWGLKLSKW